MVNFSLYSSSQNKWTQNSLVSVCVCENARAHTHRTFVFSLYSLDLFMANYCLWIRFPGLHFFYFDLFHWFLMIRSFLGDFGESLLPISWEEGSQRHICVCMHISIKVPCVICICTYICSDMHVCTFMFVSGLHMLNVYCWSMLYASDNSEISKDIF